MSKRWNDTTFTSEQHALATLTELHGRRWLCRGQSQRYDDGRLVPLIDREKGGALSRIDKLNLERRSINLFQRTARFFADPGEQGALNDDVIALMVMRHYGVPTRLLDWSASPWIAAYFAIQNDDDKDGYIWSFDEPRYEVEGRKQWEKCPETCHHGDPDKFDGKLTAFAIEEPYDWFVCGFYPAGFPRQNAQKGAYSLTARFGRDHAEKIAELLGDPFSYHLYVISADLKPRLRTILYEKHGIWRGSIFPDSAGAADTAKRVFDGWQPLSERR